MSSPLRSRWVGLALPDYFNEDFATVAVKPIYFVSSLLWFAAMPFLLLALVGLYGLQADRAGMLGRVALATAVVGTVLLAGVVWSFTFVTPTLALEAPELLAEDMDVSGPLNAGFILSFLTFPLGMILFAAATLRAGVLPRIPSVLLILATIYVSVPVSTPLAGVLIGVAIAWWGWAALGSVVDQHERRVDHMVPQRSVELG